MPNESPWPYLEQPVAPSPGTRNNGNPLRPASGAPSLPPQAGNAYNALNRQSGQSRASAAPGPSYPSSSAGPSTFASHNVAYLRQPENANYRNSPAARAVSYAGQSTGAHGKSDSTPVRAASQYQSSTRSIRGPRPLISGGGIDAERADSSSLSYLHEAPDNGDNFFYSEERTGNVRPSRRETPSSTSLEGRRQPPGTRSMPSTPQPTIHNYNNFPFSTPSLETVSPFDFTQPSTTLATPGKITNTIPLIPEERHYTSLSPPSPSSSTTRENFFESDGLATNVSRSGTNATIGSTRSRRSVDRQKSLDRTKPHLDLPVDTLDARKRGISPQSTPWPIVPFDGFAAHRLSHLARGLLIVAPRSAHSFGAEVFADCATAPEIIDAILALLPLYIMSNRHVAVDIARSLEKAGVFGKITESEAGLQDSNDEIYLLPWEDQVTLSSLPQGIVVDVLGCYSSTCPGDETCYACRCPHKQARTQHDSKAEEPLPSAIENAPEPAPPGPGRAWAETVSKDVLVTLSKDEIKRQNIIAETIETEREYVKDLEAIQKVFILGITSSKPAVIHPARQKRFLKDAFANANDLRIYNTALLKLLEDRQKDEHPVISSIGDLFLSWAVDSGPAYIAYNAHFPWADNLIRRERATNAQFDSFLKSCASLAETRRLEFRHFIQRPTQRLQRYTLLLESIIKATADDKDDKAFLQEALRMIKDLCRQSDTQLAESERRLKLKSYHENIIYKSGEPIDFGLLHPDRRVIHEGKVERKSSGFEWIEVHLLLLDNYLVMTKLIGKEPMQKFRISKRPIPLEMLQIPKVAETAIHKSGTGYHMPRITGDRAPTAKELIGPSAALTLTNTVSTTVSNTNTDSALLYSSTHNADEEGLLYPITFTHLGRLGSTTTVYCTSAFDRDRWRDRLQTTLAARATLNAARSAFEIATISKGHFGYTLTSVSKKDKAAQKYKGRVTCVSSFIGNDRNRMIVVGTDEGAWLGFEDDPSSLQQVLHLKQIQQIAVLAHFKILLALADRTLIAYALEAILPSMASRESKDHLRQPQRLSAPKEISFFRTGVVNGRTLVVTCKKKGVESIFRCLEPVHMHQEKKSLGRMFGGNKMDWFREYKTFFIPSDAYSLQFLNRMLCIICDKGFEIVNLDTLQPSTIPNWQDPNWNKLGKAAGSTMAKRAQQAHALGIFRIDQNEFLLCYDELGTICEKHGEFSRDISIEWEGKPESFVLFHPYILGFDLRFIEVRLASTGELIQIIPGNNIKCLTDSVTMNLPPSVGGAEVLKDKHGKGDSLLCSMRDVATDSYKIFKLVPIKRDRNI